MRLGVAYLQSPDYSVHCSVGSDTVICCGCLQAIVLYLLLCFVGKYVERFCIYSRMFWVVGFFVLCHELSIPGGGIPGKYPSLLIMVCKMYTALMYRVTTIQGIMSTALSFAPPSRACWISQ